MKIIEYVIEIILLLFSIHIISINLIILIIWLIRKKPISSMAPFFGGILCSIIILIQPIHIVKFYWWIPIIIDPSNYSIAYFIFYNLFHMRLYK